MAYERLDLRTGDELNEAVFKHIDDAIAINEERINGIKNVVIFNEIVNGFEYQSSLGVFFTALNSSPCVLKLGKEYTIVWDGIESTSTSFIFTNGENEMIAIGNKMLAGGENTGESFAIAYNPMTGYMNFFAMTDNTSHEIIIYCEASKLPEVTNDDNGKFLQVVDGIWQAVSVSNGNEVAY